MAEKNNAEETVEEVVEETAVEAVESEAAEEQTAPEAPAEEKAVEAAPVKAEATSNEGDAQAPKHKRAERVGIVFSDKMMKTVVVRVDRTVKHPMYRKYIKKRKKFMAHNELGAAEGDKVRIVETRPLSARKRWRVVEIIQKAQK